MTTVRTPVSTVVHTLVWLRGHLKEVAPWQQKTYQVLTASARAAQPWLASSVGACGSVCYDTGLCTYAYPAYCNKVNFRQNSRDTPCLQMKAPFVASWVNLASGYAVKLCVTIAETMGNRSFAISTGISHVH